MLIRSQDKTMLAPLSSDLYIIDTEIHIHGANYGTYSSIEKCIKVLDMVQSAYERYMSVGTLTTGTVFEIARELKTEERINEYKNNHRDIFVFQMPKDEDVEV